MVLLNLHPAFLLLIVIIAVWDLVWKIIGAWSAGRNNQFGWFIIILIFNTVGILPLIYLIWFAKDKSPRKTKEKKVIRNNKRR